MSKINEITLTPEMQAVLLRWLEEMPDAEIAGAGEMLPGGFRKPSLIRERLKGIIQGPGTIPSWVLGQVTSDLLAFRTVMALSEAALIFHLDALLAVAGPPTLLLALAADARPEVRSLAAEHLSASSRVFSDDEINAAGDIWFHFAGETVMGLVSRCLPPSPPSLKG